MLPKKRAGRFERVTNRIFRNKISIWEVKYNVNKPQENQMIESGFQDWLRQIIKLKVNLRHSL